MITSPLVWLFWYIVEDLLWEALWILEAQIGAWSDSGVSSEENMSTNFIVPELYKTGKLTKDKNVSKEKETEYPKVDNVE